jgi:hypothetical protein
LKYYTWFSPEALGMRRRLVLLIALTSFILAVSCGGLLEDWQGIGSGERPVTWQLVDSLGAVSINSNTANPVNDVKLLSYDGSLYLGYTDGMYYNVMVYSNDDSAPGWVPLPRYTSVSGFSIQSGEIIGYNGQLHLLTVENGKVYPARLRSDLSVWDSLNPAGIDYSAPNGTNQYSEKFVVYNGKLYGLWSQGLPTYVRMKRLDGSSWVGSNTTSGIEDVNSIGIHDLADSGKNNYAVSAAVNNGLLFVAYEIVTTTPGRCIKVRAYNGFSWMSASGYMSTNKTASDNATVNSVASYNGSIYLLWREYNSVTPFDGLWVRRYNSLTWNSMDGTNSTRDGLRYYKANNNLVGDPVLFVVNDRLAAAWPENGGTNMQARCALFSGDESSPCWFFIDGGNTAGLNVTQGSAVQRMDAVSHRSKIYIAMVEQYAGLYCLHVKAGY